MFGGVIGNRKSLSLALTLMERKWGSVQNAAMGCNGKRIKLNEVTEQLGDGLFKGNQ